MFLNWIYSFMAKPSIVFWWKFNRRITYGNRFDSINYTFNMPFWKMKLTLLWAKNCKSERIHEPYFRWFCKIMMINAWCIWSKVCWFQWQFWKCVFFWLICKLWSFSLSCMVSTAVGCPEKKVSVTLKMNKKIISPGVHWYLWFFLMRSIRSDALVTFNCKTNSLPNPFYCNGIQMNFARLHELVQW